MGPFKHSFLFTFIITQLILVFFHIYKYSSLTKLSYVKQKHEKIITELTEQKKELLHTFEQLKKSSAIKKWAREQGMIPIRLQNIKKIDDLHDTAS